MFLSVSFARLNRSWPAPSLVCWIREMEVVYVLVEIRKYLEQSTELRNRHPALNFYCCWAVHSEAAGNGTDRILERFDMLYHYLESSSIPVAVVESNDASTTKLRINTPPDSPAACSTSSRRSLDISMASLFARLPSQASH